MKRKSISKPIPAKTLRERCVELGINPDSTGYKVPAQRFTALDRIIPGKADREAPSVACARIPQHSGNARQRYSEHVAANHRAMIEAGGTEAYVVLFDRLNNLVAA